MSYLNKLNINPEKWKLQYVDEPFTIFKLRGVFSDENYVCKLKNEVNSLKFTSKLTDIFSLQQTNDLLLSKEHTKYPSIVTFLQFLKYFRIFLSQKLEITLDEKFSVSCSKYEDGDYLLCHDDKSEDRMIAFIFYLNQTWEEEWGGSLDLFNHDANGQPDKVTYQIYPEFNSLIFFRVGNYTYHEVAEVVSKDASRITMNGWFHSEEALKLVPLDFCDPMLPYTMTINYQGELLYLNHFVNAEFLDLKYIELIQETLKENEVVMFQNFLKPRVYEKIAQELTSPNVSWCGEGPANRRKYSLADPDTLPKTIKALKLFFQSTYMCSYLEEVSGEKLFTKKRGTDNYSGSVYSEIQHWNNGCYSTLADDDPNYKNCSLDIFIFFNVVEDPSTDLGDSPYKPGSVCYYQKFGTDIKYVVEPINNSICLALKNKEETRYVPYINKKSVTEFNLLFTSFKC